MPYYSLCSMKYYNAIDITQFDLRKYFKYIP